MSKNETSKFSRALTTARERDLIPWHLIVDETRQIASWRTWADPATYVQETMDAYRRNWWQDQPQRLLVLSEKGTVGGMLKPVLRQYAAEILVLHGFGSATALNGLAKLSVEDERPLSLLYVGDHDPSGRHMSDVDIPERLERYGGKAELVRVAVTPAHVREYALPTFPTRDKAKGARYHWFLEHHGGTCCELDALGPNVLRETVGDALKARTDWVPWERAKIVEAAEATSLSDIIHQWPGAV